MTTTQPGWPVKTREVRNVLYDSTRWNGFRFRDDDIVIATWAKSGTTWTQQIIAQLVLGPWPGLASADLSPWLDFRTRPLPQVLDQLEAQAHRRFIKTHLPIDALTFSPKVKYVYVGRDARDIVWSWFNHHANFTPEALDRLNAIPDRIGPPIEPPGCDVREYYLHWLRNDTFPGCPWLPSIWEHAQGWWDARHLPNVLLLHYGRMKEDLAREIRRISRFLGVAVDEAMWPDILEHCSFEYMRNAAANYEMFRSVFKEGGNTFFNKGTNGRWKDVLSQAEISLCDDVAARKLTPDCARWLKTGHLAGD